MTAKLARLALRGAFLAMVFMSGALVHYFYYGNYYEIIAEKTYASEIGPIQYRYVIETVGVPFLDPGTSILEYQGRTIYKARRMFQESHPVAAHIGVTNRQIIWDDGELKFQLTVEPMKKGEPLRPANGG